MCGGTCVCAFNRMMDGWWLFNLSCGASCFVVAAAAVWQSTLLCSL